MVDKPEVKYFDLLLNKQVCCYSSGSSTINQYALGLLCNMYPNFKVVRTSFDINPDQPFIYIGDQKWIPLISKQTEPHIIVATTGEYDLTDHETVLNLCYAMHNKKPLKKDLEKLAYWETNESDFYCNMKEICLLGKYQDQEDNLTQNLFLEIVSNLGTKINPAELFARYFKVLDESGVRAFKSIESSLLSYSLNAINPSKSVDIHKSGMNKIIMNRASFLGRCSKNFKTSTENYLSSSIDYLPLKYLFYILDLGGF